MKKIILLFLLLVLVFSCDTETLEKVQKNDSTISILETDAKHVSLQARQLIEKAKSHYGNVNVASAVKHLKTALSNLRETSSSDIEAYRKSITNVKAKIVVLKVAITSSIIQTQVQSNTPASDTEDDTTEAGTTEVDTTEVDTTEDDTTEVDTITVINTVDQELVVMKLIKAESEGRLDARSDFIEESEKAVLFFGEDWLELEKEAYIRGYNEGYDKAEEIKTALYDYRYAKDDNTGRFDEEITIEERTKISGSLQSTKQTLIDVFYSDEFDYGVFNSVISKEFGYSIEEISNNFYQISHEILSTAIENANTAHTKFDEYSNNRSDEVLREVLEAFENAAQDYNNAYNLFVATHIVAIAGRDDDIADAFDVVSAELHKVYSVFCDFVDTYSISDDFNTLKTKVNKLFAENSYYRSANDYYDNLVYGFLYGDTQIQTRKIEEAPEADARAEGKAAGRRDYFESNFPEDNPYTDEIQSIAYGEGYAEGRKEAQNELAEEERMQEERNFAFRSRGKEKGREDFNNKLSRIEDFSFLEVETEDEKNAYIRGYNEGYDEAEIDDARQKGYDEGRRDYLGENGMSADEYPPVENKSVRLANEEGYSVGWREAEAEAGIEVQSQSQ